MPNTTPDTLLDTKNPQTAETDEQAAQKDGHKPSAAPLSISRPPRRPRHHETHRALQALIPVMASLLTLYKVGTDAYGEWAEVEQEKHEKASRRTRLATKGQPYNEEDAGEERDVYSLSSYSFIEHMLALTTGMAKALALILVMAALIALAFVAQPVSTAIVLTALAMFALWASERLSRER